MASKLSVHEPEIFFADGQGNQWKTELFRKSLSHRKFSMWTFFRDGYYRKYHRLRFQNIYIRGGYNFFWPCFGRLKLVEGDKMRSVRKNKRCYKNRYGHNFQNIGSTMNERLFIGYEQTLIGCGSDILTVSFFLTQQFSFYFFEMRVNISCP